MFKKLIIAVLTLGLLFTFSSAAISSNVPGQKSGAELIPMTNPNAHLGTAIKDNIREVSFQKMISAKVPTNMQKVLPPQYFCDYIDYSGGAATYIWPIPDPDYGFSEYGERFESAEGYVCELQTAYIGIYYSANVGDPGMRVIVYSDDGYGTPGTNLGHVDVAGSVFADSVGYDYFAVDMSSLGLSFTDGEEFHIGVQQLGGTTLVLLSDNGEDNMLGRSWLYYPAGAGYYLNADVWVQPFDPNFLIGVDICCTKIPYSSCDTVKYDCEWAYRANQPSYGYFFNTRFTAEGPETLKSVSIQLRPQDPSWGDPDMQVYVWGDDGSGFPDTLNILAGPILIPFASIVYRPSFNVVDLSALNLVVRGDYHIGWRVVQNSSDDQLAAQMDNAALGCGADRSSLFYPYDPDTNWYMLYDFFSDGLDRNWIIRAYTCKDEFAECKNLNFAYSASGYRWRLPDPYGDIANYQRFSPKGEGCRLEQVNIRLYWRLADTLLPLYTYNSEIEVRANDPLNVGYPGALLLSQTVTPVDYAMQPPVYPALSYQHIMTVDVSAANLTFDEDVWVGIKSLAPDYNHCINTLSDDGTSPSGWRAVEAWEDSGEPYGLAFGIMGDDWNLGTNEDINFRFSIDVCCVPIPEITCEAGDDWPTMGRSFNRDTHSRGSLGDAQCNLTRAWTYVTTNAAFYNSPVAYKDTLVCYFYDRLVAVDLNTGIEIWNRPVDYFQIGSACYATPTVWNSDPGVTDKGIIFIAGGDSKAFTAINLNNGTTIWTVGAVAHSSHFMTYGPSVVFEDVPSNGSGGTMNIVIYSDDNGWIYARDVVNGNLYNATNYPGAGWATNPIKLADGVKKGLSRDNEFIYAGIDNILGDGDVYQYNATTGVPGWQLSTGPSGLQGAIVVPSKDWSGSESFTSGIAVDPIQGVLYTCSAYAPADNSSPVQDGGVLYSINTTNGFVNWAVLAPHYVSGGSGPVSMPAIDGANVIHLGWTPWVAPAGQIRGPAAFKRETGEVVWSNTTTNPGVNPSWMLEGILSCETELPDIYVCQDDANFIEFYNATTGEQLFHRRWGGMIGTTFSGRGYVTAPIMTDGRLILTWANKIVCLTNAVDPRPRLEITDYDMIKTCPFGTPDHTAITFEELIYNNGCADLTIDSVVVSETSNKTLPSLASLSTVSEKRLNRIFKNIQPKTAPDVTMDFGQLNKGFSSNDAAYTMPSFINGVLAPAPGTILAAQADPLDIVLDVNGTLVSRGLHSFYAQVWTDDPDYFIDSARIVGAYSAPETKLGLVGGCLLSSVRMQFGLSATGNYKIVFNTPMLADGDSLSYEIDHDSASYWQGSMLFTKSKYRVAISSSNWAGQDWQWKSILGDKSCIDAESCPPLLTNNVLLSGVEFTADNGENYDEVYANVMTFSYVDSVQNMDTDTSATVRWRWSFPAPTTRGQGYDPPYDDTLTMGFKGCAKVIGVPDVEGLDNFTIEKHALKARNGVPITDVYACAFMDYDVKPTNTYQMTGYDASHSVAWVYDCNAKTTGWGHVKVPFGCGYTPMINAKTIGSATGAWNDSAIWLDSVYYWASKLSGLSHQTGTSPCVEDASDRNAFWTFQKQTIPATDSATYAFGDFALVGITNADQAASYYAITTLINQFCGFGRGDVNNDGKIDLVDILYLANWLHFSGIHGPYPFKHLGDVNADGAYNDADIAYLMNYYFNFGPCPVGKWMF
jgi:outer membrane protein assembly factor BamB